MKRLHDHTKATASASVKVMKTLCITVRVYSLDQPEAINIASLSAIDESTPT
jgi:hypothetical protein